MAPDLMYIFALCPPSCKTEARSGRLSSPWSASRRSLRNARLSRADTGCTLASPHLALRTWRRSVGASSRWRRSRPMANRPSRASCAARTTPSSGSLITAGSRSSSTSSSSSSSSSSSTLGSRGGAAVPTRLGQVVMSGLSLDVITRADISTRAPQRRSASGSLARLQSRQVNIFPLARAKRPIASPGVRWAWFSPPR